MRHTTFGQDAKGDPLTVELGANWVQGLGTDGGPQNPIWLLVRFRTLQYESQDAVLILSYLLGAKIWSQQHLLQLQLDLDLR